MAVLGKANKSKHCLLSSFLSSSLLFFFFSYFLSTVKGIAILWTLPLLTASPPPPKTHTHIHSHMHTFWWVIICQDTGVLFYTKQLFESIMGWDLCFCLVIVCFLEIRGIRGAWVISGGSITYTTHVSLAKE